MDNCVRIDLNGVAMSAAVLVTDYGYRINVDGRLADKAKAWEGQEVSFGIMIEDEVIVRYQVMSSYPVPPKVLLALRKIKPNEKRKAKKEPTGRTVGQVQYG